MLIDGEYQLQHLAWRRLPLNVSPFQHQKDNKMNLDIIFSAIIGGFFVLAGNITMSWHQRKMQDTQFLSEQKKLNLEWERLETRRKDDRNFELKKEAYYNYLSLISRSSKNSVQPMEVIAALAVLQLCGSEEVVKQASDHAKIILHYVNQGISPNAVQEVMDSANKLSAAMLADFRSHTQS